MSALNFPKPKPSKEYQETIDRGFWLFPKRKENFEKFLASSKKCAVDYMPIKLDIENVSRCNLKCEMCQMTTFANQKRANDLSFDDFKKIIDEQIGVFEIKIQGVGEPLLQGDEFIEMIKYAIGKSIWVRSTTNATILHKNNNYKKVIDAGVGELQISIDGATKETYEAIRVNAKFEQSVQNCKLINSYCKEIGVQKTRMWTLLQNDNLHELFLFPTFAKELGFERLTISMDVNGWGNEEWTQKNESKKVSSMICQGDIDKLLDSANKLGVELTFWDISSKYSSSNLCPWPFERAYISSDKKIVPCCMIANPDVFNLGAAKHFAAMWHGSEYEAFRKSHIDGAIPNICKFCYQQ